MAELSAAYMVFADQMELLPYDEKKIPPPEPPQRLRFLGEPIWIPAINKHMGIFFGDDVVVMYYDPNGIPESKQQEIYNLVKALLEART